jgi:DNA-binding beta-propeller fold protein YncE
VLGALTLTPTLTFGAKPGVELRFVGTHATGQYNQSAAEIVAHDPQSQRYFVVNGGNSTIDVLDASDPNDPAFLFSIDIEQYGDQANSVDVCNGIVAAAVQADVKTDNGTVEFFDADGNHLKSVPAGALPDMLTFIPNCEKVLVANEGEPSSYLQLPESDPVGSVTIVDVSNGVLNSSATQVGFTAFNGTTLDSSVRIYGPGASIAQDLEPEYIAVDHDSKTAWITLQENNAIAVLDLGSATITDIVGLGFKDHKLPANKFDASDRDVPGSSNNGIVRIRDWPVFGMYEPDAIATFKHESDTFLITAN